MTIHEDSASNGQVFQTFHPWVTIFLCGIVVVLIIGDIALYSLFQTMQSRVELQESRIERLTRNVTDMLTTNENAKKIQKIETQVDGIRTELEEVTSVLKVQNSSDH